MRVVSLEKMRDAARVGNGERCVDGRVDVADPRYDLVLCDAPCSSTGAMRRTPSMRWLIAGDVAEWKRARRETTVMTTRIATDATPFGTRRRGATATATASLPRWTSTRWATQPAKTVVTARLRSRTAAGVPAMTCPFPKFSGGSSPRLRGFAVRTAARSCTRRVRF